MNGGLEYDYLIYVYEQVKSIDELAESERESNEYDHLLNENYRVLIETIDNIENNFGFIGILEEMGTSLDILKRIFWYEDGRNEEKSDLLPASRSSRKSRGAHESSAFDSVFSEQLIETIFEKN